MFGQLRATFGYYGTKLYNSLYVKPPLLLNDFSVKRIVSDDTYNGVKNGNVKMEYYSNHSEKDEEIGYIDYRVHNGQIGLFYLRPEYRNRGLGKQILTKVIDELRENNVKEVWAVTREDHPFWSNVFNKSFKWKVPAHKSVTGSGYVMAI